MATILKKNYNLRGVSLFPVIRRLKGNREDPPQFARLSTSRLLEELTMPELEDGFADLTGESLIECLEMAQREANVGNARLLVHHCILYANEAGQPKGQILKQPEEVEPPPIKRQKMDGVDNTVEKRLDSLEKKNAQSGENLVNDLKNKVRVLSMQTTPNEALLLLALDELARTARKVGHPEADTFDELARQASRYQGKICIATLGLSVIGDKASDAVTKALSKCLKEKQTTPDPSPPGNSGISVPRPQLPPNTYYQFQMPEGFIYPGMSVGSPNQFAPQFPYQTGPYQPYGNNIRPRYPYRQSRPRGTCMVCDSPGHYVRDCEKLKAFKKTQNQ